VTVCHHAQKNPAPTQAGQVACEVLQHLHIGRGQLLGVGDDGNLLGPVRGQRLLHRLFQPQLCNPLVDVSEQSQALITREVFDRHRRSPGSPKGLQGLGSMQHGLFVLTRNDQILIIVQNNLAQILQHSRRLLQQ
jgi:hypothetical protein